MSLKVLQTPPAQAAEYPDDWEKAVDSLAIALCPIHEWQAYEQKMQLLVWKSRLTNSKARLHVFPVWRKYRQQAIRVATLYNTFPFLRQLPLKWANAIGELLFR